MAFTLIFCRTIPRAVKTNLVLTTRFQGIQNVIWISLLFQIIYSLSLPSTNSRMLLTKIGDDGFVGDFGSDSLEIYSKYKLIWIICIRQFDHRSILDDYVPLFHSLVDYSFCNCSKNVKSNLQFKPRLLNFDNKFDGQDVKIVYRYLYIEM